LATEVGHFQAPSFGHLANDTIGASPLKGQDEVWQKHIENVQSPLLDERKQHTNLAAPYAPCNLVKIPGGGEPGRMFAIGVGVAIDDPALPGSRNVGAWPATFARDLGERVAWIENGRKGLH
jgi:hypothetical protein